jgi:hypothetical protein
MIGASIFAALAFTTGVGTVATVHEIRQGGPNWRKSAHEVGLEQTKFVAGVLCTVGLALGAWLAI